MDVIKLEVDEDCLSCENSCFICLQSVAKINERQFNSVNLFFNYLKISREGEKAFVCENCEEKIVRFGKLCNMLEKVRLEMDYLLGFIQNAIKNSNKDLDPVSVGVNSVRNLIFERCQEKISIPKPEIVLKRIDLSKQISHQCQAANLTNDDSSSNEGEGAPPAITEAMDFEMEENLKDAVTTTEGIKSPRCPNILSRKKTHLVLKPFKCSKCPLQFGDLSTLRDHTSAIHLHIKLHKCDLCDQSFKRFQDLRRHKASHFVQVQIQRPPTFNCEICAKEFNDQYLLNLHMQKAHPDARFPCSVCKKRFKSRHNLNRHISDYHDKEKFDCEAPNCGKSYNYKAVLDVHYRLKHPDFNVSTPIRPPSSEALYSYAKYCRNGESGVECERCGCKFSSLDQVVSHIRIVHDKRFVCTECGYKTDDKYFFDLHTKLIHKKGGESENDGPEYILP